jgi:hypothetical protein
LQRFFVLLRQFVELILNNLVLMGAHDG